MATGRFSIETGKEIPTTGIDSDVIIDEEGKPVFVKPLTTDALSGFSGTNPDHVALMNEYLNSAGMSDPVKLRQAQSKYLERFNITPDDPRYEAEMERLAENGTRFMLGEARRVAERQQTMHEINGDLTQNVVYIAEDDENTCDECPELNGEEGPYIQLARNNMLPGDRCEGGNNCRCIIVAVN
jgi:hypothetical protein